VYIAHVCIYVCVYIYIEREQQGCLLLLERFQFAASMTFLKEAAILPVGNDVYSYLKSVCKYPY